MLRGIFGALKSSVQYCVGVKSRLLSLLLYLHQFSKLWKLLTFYTTCWTVKSQFSWSVVNVPGGGGKACLRSLGRASFSCVPPHFQSHRVLLFWNPGSLLWEGLGRTLELPCFHRCSLKGGWKCDSETLIFQSSNKNDLSDWCATTPEVLTWRDFFLPSTGIGKSWRYFSGASYLSSFSVSSLKRGYW